MGWNIDDKEKLVISKDNDNNALALKHLLDAMGKEDALRGPNKPKNEDVGDASDEDDDGLSEDDSEQEDEVQGIYNSPAIIL